MWYIILVVEYFVWLRHSVIAFNPIAQMRPVILAPDIHKKSPVWRHDPVIRPPEPLLRHKPKPLCGPVPIIGLSCEQPASYKNLYLNRGVSLNYQAIYSTIKPLKWSQIKRSYTPRHQINRVPRVMPIPTPFQDQPLQIMPTLASRIPRYKKPVQRQRLKNQNLQYKAVLPGCTIAKRLMMISTSTRPPYPGGIRPKTEEISGFFTMCEAEVWCYKFVWPTKQDVISNQDLH